MLSPLVIVPSGAPTSGLFVYSGTPKSGNPPVFSVVAPGVTSDPFGNAVNPVMSAGNPAGAMMNVDAAGNLVLYSPAGNKVIVIHPDLSAVLVYTAAGSGAGNLAESIAPTAGTDAFGNAFLAGDVVYSHGTSGGTTVWFAQQMASGVLTWYTSPGDTGYQGPWTNVATGGYNSAALHNMGVVPAGLLIGSTNAGAGNGGTLTLLDAGGAMLSGSLSAQNAGAPETWHTITLDAGWSTAAGHAAPSYQLLPDGNVQLTGFASHAAFTVSTALNSGTPLPAAYRPVTSKYLRAGDSNRAGLSLGTNGVITAFPVSGGSTQLELDSVYPLNL